MTVGDRGQRLYDRWGTLASLGFVAVAETRVRTATTRARP
jgi:hypothetical protein